MFRGAIVRSASEAPAIHPGGFLVVLTNSYLESIRARRLGYEVRDTILVVGWPGTRFAFLCRRPCTEPTVAENVLRYGTGALWISACRVGTSGGGTDCQFWPGKCPGHTNQVLRPTFHGDPPPGWPNVVGRWPPNLVYRHAPECRKVGTTRVRGSSNPVDQPRVAVRRSGVHQAAGGHQTPGRANLVTGYSEPDGTEIVDAWDCEDGCLVPSLDQQSRADSGGASRYFPQFGSDEDLVGWLRTLIGGDEISILV